MAHRTFVVTVEDHGDDAGDFEWSDDLYHTIARDFTVVQVVASDEDNDD